MKFILATAILTSVIPQAIAAPAQKPKPDVFTCFDAPDRSRVCYEKHPMRANGTVRQTAFAVAGATPGVEWKGHSIIVDCAGAKRVALLDRKGVIYALQYDFRLPEHTRALAEDMCKQKDLPHSPKVRLEVHPKP
jgi:hypothetical protein